LKLYFILEFIRQAVEKKRFSRNALKVASNELENLIIDDRILTNDDLDQAESTSLN